MSGRTRTPADRWSRIVTGTGIGLGAFVALEILWFRLRGESLTPEFVIGLITSIPFVALLVVIGWRLSVTLTPGRHRRVGAWMLAGLLVFLAINLAIMPLYPRPHLYEHVAWVRWAVALGAGTGVLVGRFEARAIDRELEAERNRLLNRELEAQNERLDEFAAILSHDLRNPLNVASGNIDLVKRDYESDRLDAAATALSRMDEIIEETLVLARSGRVIGETEPVDIGALVETCWQSVETEAATLEVDDPPIISGDTDRLRHLVENLFRNSVHHGGGSVTIRVGACPGGFFVEDDGPGIPEADRETVFSTGFSTASDGNGFGLAIVQQIAEAHGWSSRIVESASGGARFEFTGVDVRND